MDSIIAVCCLGLLTLLDFGLGIAEIVVGSVHLRSCPAESRIPIYLLVIGCTSVLLSVMNGLRTRQMREQQRQKGAEESPLQSVRKPASAADGGISTLLASLLGIFTLIWIVCGMLWIFSTTVQFNSPAKKQYCLQPLFVFAQAAVLIRLIVLCLFFMGLCCCMCCVGCLFVSS